MEDQNQFERWCRVGLQIMRLSHTQLSWTVCQVMCQLQLSREPIEAVINRLVLCGAPLLIIDDGIYFQTRMAICDHDKVVSSLSLQASSFHSYWQVSSTQDYCLGLHDDTNVEFCLAEHQTAGRGRRSKKWQSFFSTGVLFSYRKILPADFNFSAYALMLSLEIVDALQKRFPDLDIGIKWPNDVWLNGKKLLGILVETVPVDEQMLMVVGVGCNFLCHDGDSMDSIAGLQVEFCSLDKTELVILLMRACRRAVGLLQKKDFMHYCARYNKRHIFHGYSVQFIQDSYESCGVVEGVSGCGALQLQTAEGCVELVSAGSIVNLRPAAGSI